VSYERNRQKARHQRQLRVRRKIVGTLERPRLCVTKTLRHTYAQIIDDYQGHTLVAASTMEDEVRNGLASTSNKEAAAAVGKVAAQRALAKDIRQVVFDRAGWPYHGKIQALAEAAREAGLEL